MAKQQRPGLCVVIAVFTAVATWGLIVLAMMCVPMSWYGSPFEGGAGISAMFIFIAACLVMSPLMITVSIWLLLKRYDFWVVISKFTLIFLLFNYVLFGYFDDVPCSWFGTLDTCESKLAIATILLSLLCSLMTQWLWMRYTRKRGKFDDEHERNGYD